MLIVSAKGEDVGLFECAQDNELPTLVGTNSDG